MIFSQSYAKVMKLCQSFVEVMLKFCQVMPKLCQSNEVITNYAKVKKFCQTNAKDSKFYMLKL
jgi:hypothetical protein